MDPDLQQPGKPPVSKQDLFMSPSLPPQIEPNKPKSKKKLVFIVAGVVALLLIVTVIAVVSSPKKKPTTTNTAQSTGEKSFASTDMQKIVQQYLSDMNTGKYTDAYKLISISNVTQDQFVKSYAPIFASSYDISKCTIQTDNQISHSSVVVNCPHKSGGSTVLEFKFDKVQNSLVIVEVKSLREDRA